MIRGLNRKDDNIVNNPVPFILPSKEFDSMLSMNSLYKLEEYSKACHDFFDNVAGYIDKTEIQAKLPAFVSDLDGRPLLYIKYPTYKIVILDKKFSSFPYSYLESLIAQNYKIKDYRFYSTSNPVFVFDGGSMEEFPSGTCEIRCERNNLHANEALTNTLASILKENSIKHNIVPGYYVNPKAVKVELLNGKQYIQILK